MLCQLLLTIARGLAGKKGGKRVDVMDFMPWGDGVTVPGDPKKQSVEQMRAALKAIAGKQGTRKRKH